MKLTPVELSKDPTRVSADAGHYDFATQKRIGMESALLRGSTRTYDTVGRPKDTNK